MDKIVYLYYPLLFVFLLWGSTFYRRKSWNEEFMSLSQTKALQGFCAICILLHHVGQNTCAPWLDSKLIVHGLDVFVPIGYFFVGVFFFCSGYGLYKSYKEKPNYLQGFCGRRIFPLVLTLVTTTIIYMTVRQLMGEMVGLPRFFFNLSGPQIYNPYVWFVLALLLFYIAFYLAFKYCKSEKVAVLVTCLVVLLYIVHCDWWMYGGWWYNTVPIFCVGILFARYEDALIKGIKKCYLFYVILALLATLGFHYLSLNTQELLTYLGHDNNYDLRRWVTVLSQMVASFSFVILLFLLGMKIKIGNKALAFMGTITLEFYLIQGLFIQMFGYFFFTDKVKPIYYIRNVALLVLVVLVLSITSALLLRKLHKKIISLLVEYKAIVAIFRRDMKIVAIILLALVLGITLIVSTKSHIKSFNMKETISDYKEANITYADIDGRKMAAYATGKGAHTIVVLSDIIDPCPTITLKPVADELAKKNRVIILDYLGSGFSDSTDKERTAENFVYEIHTALKSLGEKGPFIMMPHNKAGIYTQHYTYTYPNEVEAVIGLDSCVPKQLGETLKEENVSPDDYQRTMKKEAKLKYFYQRFLALSGYVRTQWREFEPLLDYSHTRTEFDIVQEMFIDRFYSKNVVDEMAHDYKNFNTILNKKYAEELPVLFMLSYDTCAGPLYNGSSWQQLHEDLITNDDIQKIQIVNGNIYYVYIKPDVVAQLAQEFIDKLDNQHTTP